MKSRIQLAWLMVGIALTISRLAAQDVTVTDPTWWDPENPSADQLPTFKKRPKPEYPQELGKSGQVAYAIVEQIIDPKGERLHRHMLCSNPYVEKTGEIIEKFSPATRAGKPVMANCWYGIIYNPASAKLGGGEVTPRLLAVAPVLVDKKEPSFGGEMPSVIWATVNLNEKGVLQDFVFDVPAHEVFREMVGGAIHRWKFAPARRGGQPVAAVLRVPIILSQPYHPNVGGTPPKTLYREPPEYPRTMKNSGLRGEVLLEFTVDKTGTVKDPVVKQSNNPNFNEPAIAALLKWKFEPGRSGGEPVAAKMQQPFEFDFDGGSGHDLTTLKIPSKKKQQALPPELQFDIAPTPKNFQHPVFPYTRLRDEKTGHATVAYIINDKGKVFQLLVKEASGPEFGMAVAAAVETFEYIPALKDGKPTYAGLQFTQDFDESNYGKSMEGKEDRLLALEKKHPEKILSPKKLDAPVKPISQKPPVFPCALKESHQHGEAMVEILIDETGYVRLPRIRSATEPAFGYAAVQAIAEWRFEPPIAAGKPVVARAVVPFIFSLTDDQQASEEASAPIEKK